MKRLETQTNMSNCKLKNIRQSDFNEWYVFEIWDLKLRLTSKLHS